MENLFEKQGVENITNRLNSLKASSERSWGKMNPSQMLAHCNVAYEMVYEPEKHPPATGFKKFILKLIVKGIVTGTKPYKNNSRTAPAFVISSEKEFEKEKARLVEYLNQTQELGTSHFEGKESNSFGALTATEWNNMLSRHLDHHFKQFGA